MIVSQNVSLNFGAREVLKNISASARDGRVLGLVGPNGAGKSTLLNALFRTLQPHEGTILVDDRDVSKLSRQQIARRISVVAQQTESTLPLPVRDAVALGRLARHNLLDYSSAVARQKVDDAIAQVGLLGFEERLTNELSGGELQRVLIARAIVQEASHILLDEPTNHLDIHHQYLILEMVRSLGATTVIVLHDLNLATQFCDDLVLLHEGRIVAAGTPCEVLTSERVSSVYQMDADVITHCGQPYLVFRSKARSPEMAISA